MGFPQINPNLILGIGDSIAGGINDWRTTSNLQDAVQQATGPDGTVDYGKVFQSLLAHGDTKNALAIAKMQELVGGGGNNVYGIPVWGRDSATGKEGLGAWDKNGKFHRIDTPGFQPERGVTVEDLGYGRAVVGKGSGEVQNVIPQTGDLPSGYVPPQNYNPWGGAPAPANGVAPPQNPNELPVGGPESPLAPSGAGGYMPGTKESIEQKAREEQQSTKENIGKLSLGVVSEDIGRAKKLIQSDPFFPVTGFFGGATANIYGTPAHDLQQLLEPIKSSMTLERLTQLRQSSPTGGALGNISDRDMQVLSSAWGSIVQSQSKDQLLHNLDRFEQTYNEIINGPSAGVSGVSSGTPNVVDWKTYFPGAK